MDTLGTLGAIFMGVGIGAMLTLAVRWYLYEEVKREVRRRMGDPSPFVDAEEDGDR